MCLSLLGQVPVALLDSLGSAAVSAVQRLDPARGAYESCAYTGTVRAGDDFEIRQGEGYLIHTLRAVPAFNPNDAADRCP